LRKVQPHQAGGVVEPTRICTLFSFSNLRIIFFLFSHGRKYAQEMASFLPFVKVFLQWHMVSAGTRVVGIWLKIYTLGDVEKLSSHAILENENLFQSAFRVS
jgi:hypothetical protein